MTYSIKVLADLAGVTVKTLHHYHDIELLIPELIKENGYRDYSDANLSRLQLIVLLKKAGFSLRDIGYMLRVKSVDMGEIMRQAKERVLFKKEELSELYTKLDQYEKNSGLLDISIQSHLDAGLDNLKSEALASEAYGMWGDTKVFEQSVKRTSKFGKDDWKRIIDEGKKIVQGIADVKKDGVDSLAVQKLIGDYHDYMQNFYDCSLETYKGLGEMYLSDPRFRKKYEDVSIGLAEFMRDAILVYVEERRE